jgi:hypothetical protein
MKRTDIRGYKVVTLEEGTREMAFEETSLHKMKATCGYEEWKVNEECMEIECNIEDIDKWNRMEACIDGMGNGNYMGRRR